MFVFCCLFVIHIACFVMLAWIWSLIIRLYTDKHFRECPPYVPTLGLEKSVIIDSVSDILIKSSKQLTIVDPGCGLGGLIIKLAKNFPQHHFIGIEWNKAAAKLAQIRSKDLKNIEILRQDFLIMNLVMRILLYAF